MGWLEVPRKREGWEGSVLVACAEGRAGEHAAAAAVVGATCVALGGLGGPVYELCGYIYARHMVLGLNISRRVVAEGGEAIDSACYRCL